MDYQQHYTAEAVNDLRRHNNREVYRMYSTLGHIPTDTRAVLDVGAGEGHFLSYLRAHRGPELRLAGLEVSTPRASAHLDIQQGSILDLDGDTFSGQRFDVVTCLEVLEHLEDWRAGLARLLAVAERKVIVTVPFEEDIHASICVHCHKPTPRYGHLHRFDAHSFDYLRDEGFAIELDFVMGENASLFLQHLYYRVVARPYWILLVVHLDAAPRPRATPTRALHTLKQRALGFVPRPLLERPLPFVRSK